MFHFNKKFEDKDDDNFIDAEIDIIETPADKSTN